MTWEILNIIGTIAFAISGAIIAMEEQYDLFGVYVLGLSTAFGGGVIRNVLIGIPVTIIWEQGSLFTAALISMTLVFALPPKWVFRWKRWGHFLDAAGLSAFAVQGALYAFNMKHPLSAIIVAAMLTGIGGGIIRDLLARRKPLVLHQEIYAVWAALVGFVIGIGWVNASSSFQLYVLFAVILLLRMLSILFSWRLPTRDLKGLKFK